MTKNEITNKKADEHRKRIVKDSPERSSRPRSKRVIKQTGFKSLIVNRSYCRLIQQFFSARQHVAYTGWPKK